MTKFTSCPIAWVRHECKIETKANIAKIAMSTGHTIHLADIHQDLIKLYALIKCQPSHSFPDFLDRLCAMKPPLPCIWRLRTLEGQHFAEVYIDFVQLEPVQ